MKSVMLGIGLVALIALGARVTTGSLLEQSSAEAYASPHGSVRLDAGQ